MVEMFNSNQTFLNSRLAAYYEIDDITGDKMRLVSLEEDARRGGILTHGSLLKVTANGTNTSPILRGIWVSERLLGVAIPPPPTDAAPAPNEPISVGAVLVKPSFIFL